MFGAIEAGGTKFVCAVGDADHVREKAVIPTTDAETTMGAVTSFLADAARRHGDLLAIGIGSFGPLDLDPRSPAFGRLTTTPKIGWQDVDMPQVLRERFAVPVAIDTDVNTAALAEARASGVPRLAYVTVGTGIGVGIVIDGKCQVGFGHPEAGHVPLRRHAAHGDFPGVCPFHGDCAEGLASGPAIAAAWGEPLSQLAPDHPAWAVQAAYVGQLCAMLVLVMSPERIVLGGGVMQQARLLPMVREAALATLGGYCGQWDLCAAEQRIVAPTFDEPSGLLGAFLLAEDIHWRDARREPTG